MNERLERALYILNEIDEKIHTNWVNIRIKDAILLIENGSEELENELAEYEQNLENSEQAKDEAEEALGDIEARFEL